MFGGMDMKLTGELKVAGAMALFGSIGVFVKNIQLPSMEIAFLRSLIAAIALIFIKAIRSKKSFQGEKKNIFNNKRDFYILVLSGIALGINWFIIFQAYKYTTLSNANLVYYFSPVFVILFSPFLFNEKLTKVKVISVLAATLGLAMILFNQPTSAGTNYNHILGVTYALLGGALYAVIIFLNKKIEGIDGNERTVVQLSAAALVLLPFIIYRNAIHITGLQMVFFILILGLVHTAVGLSIYFSAMEKVKAQNIALLSYIDPISAVIFGVLVFGDVLNAFQIIGGLLILISTYYGSAEKEVKA